MQAAIQALHVANRALNGPRLVLISAGGSSLSGKLCAVPGASATLLEAQAPYALAATDDILGYKPDHYVSAAVSVELARAAQRRAAQLHLFDSISHRAEVAGSFAGAACTASLRTVEPKRGLHQAHMAVALNNRLYTTTAYFHKESRNRQEEDEIASVLLFQLILRATRDFIDVTAPPHNEHVTLLDHSLMQIDQHINSSLQLESPVAFAPRETAASSSTPTEPASPPPHDGTSDHLHWAIHADDRPFDSITNASSSSPCMSLVMPTSVPAFPPVPVPGGDSCDGEASAAGALPRQNVVRMDARRPFPVPAVVMPGSFNPLHKGHERIILEAQRAAQRKASGDAAGSTDAFWPIVLELAATNVDKPPVPPHALRQRVQQCAGWGTASSEHDASVWSHEGRLLTYPQLFDITGVSGKPMMVAVTNTPKFVDKAQLFPGSAFVVGYDTARRLVMPKYADGTMEGVVTALHRLRGYGTQFLVAGRQVAAGERQVDGQVSEQDCFLTLEDMKPHIPRGFEDMFVSLDPEATRVDISSTDIRSAMAIGHPE